MKQRSIIRGLMTTFLSILLAACVGGGGSSGGPLGGPVGAPGAIPGGGGVTDMGDTSVASGESVVSLGAPEMPDVPVAPQLDVEDYDNKPRPVEFRLEGKIISACQISNTNQVRKKIAAQLLCRWQDTQDDFTVCGKGRYIKAFDHLTHYYVEVQASETDSRFELEFTFNRSEPQARLRSFSNSHRLLLAKYIPGNEQHVSDTLNDGKFQNIGKHGLGSEDDDGYTPPFDFGETNDEADKNLSSDESELIFYARATHLADPFELGIQKWCSQKAWCEPGPAGSYVRLGPLSLIDLAFAGDDISESLPTCP